MMRTLILAFILAASLAVAQDTNDVPVVTNDVPVVTNSVPLYTNGQHYVWAATNAYLATNALYYINASSGWFPMTGRNAETGKPEPDKPKTLNWYPQVDTRPDGKVHFPRLPEPLLDIIGVPAEMRTVFITLFKPDIEMYDPTWVPAPEE
jgi:hypothetical protein